ncbi:hypothetical protein TUM4438_41340 [Shewanella sairae]|uniref:Uncharacterized protein n=1 Tax=Shewanella sairae TaxID=190310 RepID=A0ABQ4PQK8_9GAMM|nr:hypothetical protein TUM4438_41340 [Shewanella sairae]
MVMKRLLTSLGVAIGGLFYDTYLSSSPTIDFIKPVFIFLFAFAVLSIFHKNE